MKTSELTLDTRNQQVLDLTTAVNRFCRPLGDGLVNVFAPHATCGLALIETGSGSEDDLQEAIGRLVPRDDRWTHRHGSPGHGADHVLPAFVSPSRGPGYQHRPERSPVVKRRRAVWVT